MVRSGKSPGIFLNVQLTGSMMSWLWDARGREIKEDPQAFGQSNWENGASIN